MTASFIQYNLLKVKPLPALGLEDVRNFSLKIFSDMGDYIDQPYTYL